MKSKENMEVIIMDLNFLKDYLVLVILGICLCVGFIIKTSVPKIKNDYIPLIMGVLGVVINVWLNMSLNPDIILAGLFSGLASTGLHQLFTRMINKEE